MLLRFGRNFKSLELFNFGFWIEEKSIRLSAHAEV